MTEAIITALITGVVAIVTCVISNYYQNQSQNARMEKAHNETIALVTYRIAQLEKKQDLHNNAVERLYLVEQKIGIDEEKIRVVNHRISDLEELNK